MTKNQIAYQTMLNDRERTHETARSNRAQERLRDKELGIKDREVVTKEQLVPSQIGLNKASTWEKATKGVQNLTRAFKETTDGAKNIASQTIPWMG